MTKGKVRGCTVFDRPERGYSLAALFGVDRGDRAWCRTEAVPQDHGGYAHEVREQHAAKPVVAKEGDGVVVGTGHLIDSSRPCIAV